MGDRRKEREIQTTCLTFVFVQFPCLFGRADQLVQSLHIGGKFIQKIGCLFRVIHQAVTPLFGLMMLTVLHGAGGPEFATGWLQSLGTCLLCSLPFALLFVLQVWDPYDALEGRKQKIFT